MLVWEYNGKLLCIINMSVNAFHISFALGVSGIVGTLVMSNIIRYSYKAQCNYGVCKKYWHKAQKYKFSNLKVKFMTIKRKFFYCLSSNAYKLPKDD